MSKFIKYTLFTLALLIPLKEINAEEKCYKIAIVVPMSHEAMDYIVTGFKEQLENGVKGQYKLTIYHAQGDPNLMKTIFHQVSNNNYDAVLPIGTNTTQLAIKMLKKDKKVISIAAEISEEDKVKNTHLINVQDMMPMEEFVQFIQMFISNPKHLTLIHSNDARIFNQSKLLNKLLKNIGCDLQIISIQNIPEIFSASQNISKKSQAILVLKDHLVVSGMTSIVNIARKYDIFVIASDQGSVKNGADIALGVKEKELGIMGAKIVMSLIDNHDKIHHKFDNKANLIIFKNKNSLLRAFKSDLYKQELIVKN